MGQNVIALVSELSTQVKEAKAEAERLHAEVKRMHKETYGPLCEEKRIAAERHASLKAKLDRLVAENKELFDAIRSAK